MKKINNKIKNRNKNNQFNGIICGIKEYYKLVI